MTSSMMENIAVIISSWKYLLFTMILIRYCTPECFPEMFLSYCCLSRSCPAQLDATLVTAIYYSPCHWVWFAFEGQCQSTEPSNAGLEPSLPDPKKQG